ncbi:MAG: hypothetical protein NXY57DRAFT_1042605 [Lentinula lateritia]|nr:MAG: hypothetical protein NXY57DRAFT_1042605 [Lentinula lateritia]
MPERAADTAVEWETDGPSRDRSANYEQLDFPTVPPQIRIASGPGDTWRLVWAIRWERQIESLRAKQRARTPIKIRKHPNLHLDSRNVPWCCPSGRIPRSKIWEEPVRSSNILVKSCQEWQKKTLPLRSIVPVYRPVNFDSEALQFRPLQQKTKGYKPADQSLSQGLKPAERPITLRKLAKNLSSYRYYHSTHLKGSTPGTSPDEFEGRRFFVDIKCLNCQNGKSVKANRVGFYNVLTSRGDEGGFRVGRYVSNIDSYSVLESDGHQSCPDSFLECHDYTQKSEFPNIVKGYLGKRGSIMQDEGRRGPSQALELEERAGNNQEIYIAYLVLDNCLARRACNTGNNDDLG